MWHPNHHDRHRNGLKWGTMLSSIQLPGICSIPMVRISLVRDPGLGKDVELETKALHDPVLELVWTKNKGQWQWYRKETFENYKAWQSPQERFSSPQDKKQKTESETWHHWCTQYRYTVTVDKHGAYPGFHAVRESVFGSKKPRRGIRRFKTLKTSE